VRLAYFLGLEKLNMQAEDVDEKLDHNRHRGKVALSCEGICHQHVGGALICYSRLLLPRPADCHSSWKGVLASE
jgi:hypothetical protein